MDLETQLACGCLTCTWFAGLVPLESKMNLTFNELREKNRSRANRWHPAGIGEWSVADWALAMAGEAGEVCNAIKKLKRIEDGIANLSADPHRQLSTRQDAVRKIGEELADVAIYLDLLAQRLGLDLQAEVVAKFNAVSERYEYPERLKA